MTLSASSKREERAMNEIEVFTCDAEAIICGDTYDVRVVEGPDSDDLCVVDVPFCDGSFIERLAVMKDNVFPKEESAIFLLMS